MKDTWVMVFDNLNDLGEHLENSMLKPENIVHIRTHFLSSRIEVLFYKERE